MVSFNYLGKRLCSSCFFSFLERGEDLYHSMNQFVTLYHHVKCMEHIETVWE